MRVELLTELRRADNDPEVRVSIIRGSGPCFSAGYDLRSGNLSDGSPIYSAPGDGQWARQATDTWFSIWDLAHPVIAQVHGYAIAGGTELASACDLVYVAEDAAISYPVVRVASPPDWQYHTPLLGMRRAMELMLTGDPITGDEAVPHRLRQPGLSRPTSWRRRCWPSPDGSPTYPRTSAQHQQAFGAPLVRRLGRPGGDAGRFGAAGARRAHRDGAGGSRRHHGRGEADPEASRVGLVWPICPTWRTALRMTLARRETGASHQPDRRRTIDLVRVERGEPERRNLPRRPRPDLSVQPDEPASGDD